MSKHLSVEKMMSKDHRLTTEQVASYAVMNSDRMTGNSKQRIIEDLINKCIDDTIAHEQSESFLEMKNVVEVIPSAANNLTITIQE